HRNCVHRSRLGAPRRNGLSRSARCKWNRGNAAAQPPPAQCRAAIGPAPMHLSATEQESAIPFVDVGTYPTRTGNAVTPWIDGEPAFDRICEAIESARHSVWATITFMWPTFRMPRGRGSALDVLECAARRGLDVRLICWRPDDETASLRTNAF